MGYTITLHWSIDIIHTSDGDHELNHFSDFTGISREDLIKSADAVEDLTDAQAVFLYTDLWWRRTDGKLHADIEE